MTAANAIWEKLNTELWMAIDDYAADEFVARADGLVAEVPPGSAIGLFERGAAPDSVGQPENGIANRLSDWIHAVTPHTSDSLKKCGIQC